MVNTRDEYEQLFGLYVPIALAVTALVFAVVLFAAVRYRRRDERLPSQRTEAHRAEGLYGLGLLVVAGVLVAATFSAEERVDSVSDRPGLRVAVTASNWRWRFDYPELGISEVGAGEQPATLVVPSDATVHFELTALDVIHSFYVPEVRFKRDAFPERTSRFDLVFPAQPYTRARCAEFCGLKHSEMLFNVRALPPAEFDAWVRQRQAVPEAPA